MDEFERLKQQKDEIINRQSKRILAAFDGWWIENGRFHDPDSCDINWFDKRRLLAEYAWANAVRECFKHER